MQTAIGEVTVVSLFLPQASSHSTFPHYPSTSRLLRCIDVNRRTGVSSLSTRLGHVRHSSTSANRQLIFTVLVDIAIVWVWSHAQRFTFAILKRLDFFDQTAPLRSSPRKYRIFLGNILERLVSLSVKKETKNLPTVRTALLKLYKFQRLNFLRFCSTPKLSVKQDGYIFHYSLKTTVANRVG